MVAQKVAGHLKNNALTSQKLAEKQHVAGWKVAGTM